MDIHLQAILIALLGMALQVTLKIYSLKVKASNANIKLTVGGYFKQDWLMLLAAIITIIIFVLLIDDMMHLHANAVHYIKFLFAFIGYTGSDLILRFFSAANRKINAIINQQTDHAPESTQINGQTSTTPPTTPPV